MQISEVRIKLMDEPSERLQAFCSITFDDCFVIRDLKIIEGSSGPFVAMPSRKLTSHCPNCGCKNHLRAAHCNQCGARLKEDRAVKDSEGRAKLYADIAHPINSSCREMIQNRVIEEFHLEQERAKQPGYVSRYDDFDLDYDSPDAPPRPATQTKFDPAHAPQPPHKTAATSHSPQSGPGQTHRTDSAARPPAPHTQPPAPHTQPPVPHTQTQASHAQPPAPHTQPPAPHTQPESASNKAASTTPNGNGPKNSNFGAGIF